jgi:hypothetical protein
MFRWTISALGAQGSGLASVVQTFRSADKAESKASNHVQVLPANGPPVLDAKGDGHGLGVSAPAGARSRSPAPLSIRCVVVWGVLH